MKKTLKAVASGLNGHKKTLMNYLSVLQKKAHRQYSAISPFSHPDFNCRFRNLTESANNTYHAVGSRTTSHYT